MALPQAFVDLVMSDAVASYRTARDFNAMAAVLNAPTERGPVPINELSSFCIVQGITGAVLALVEVPLGAEIAPGFPMTLQIKGLLHTVRALILDDFRLETADVDSAELAAAMGGLVGMGVMTAGQSEALLLLAENRLSPAEVALGRPCTGSDCLAASGGD